MTAIYKNPQLRETSAESRMRYARTVLNQRASAAPLDDQRIVGDHEPHKAIRTKPLWISARRSTEFPRQAGYGSC